jgi:serine/threonine protein kinase
MLPFLRCVADGSRTHVLVLELAEGGDFFSLLRWKTPLPEPLARTYFRQLIAGTRPSIDVHIDDTKVRVSNDI